MSDQLSTADIPVPDLPEGEIPDEFTPAPPPPYPGKYVLQLPSNLDDPEMYQEFETNVNEKGLADSDGNNKAKRVAAVFDDNHPLVVTQTPTEHEDEIDKILHVRINNRERNRAKKGTPPALVPDTAYLLRALDPKKQTIPDWFVRKNADLKEKLSKFPGRSFKVDIEWQTSCSETRDAYVRVQQEGGAEVLEAAKDEAGNPRKGCGTRYYTRDFQVDGQYVYELECQCGAALRPFAQLRNFGSVS